MTPGSTSTSDYYSNNYHQGEFIRPDSQFRQWVRADGSTRFEPEPGRYHLYVSLACPWSHRAVILRRLRGLESVIGMSVTSPVWNEQGWCFEDFPGMVPDPVHGVRDVIDLYRRANPSFHGEETVPILWDRKLDTLVNNESRDIMRMFDTEFAALAGSTASLYPPALAAEIDAVIDAIYGPINNGVYQAGFARTQAAYERAVNRLFAALDQWEGKLARQSFTCGDTLTEADVALFVTLIRFDAVYYGHFKCNHRRIIDYPALSAWLARMYEIPGIAATCELNHIKNHYYRSHRDLNPTGIVPVGPDELGLRPVS